MNLDFLKDDVRYMVEASIRNGLTGAQLEDTPGNRKVVMQQVLDELRTVPRNQGNEVAELFMTVMREELAKL